MEIAKSMLSGVGLEKKLWEKAIFVIGYLINRSPMSYLMDKTLMEVWRRKNPSLQNLHVFGCEEYVLALKEKQSKLDNKAVKCISIGYGVSVKGYKIWDHVVEIFLYRKNVNFREANSSHIVV
jgi:hypothetical protein